MFEEFDSNVQVVVHLLGEFAEGEGGMVDHGPFVSWLLDYDDDKAKGYSEINSILEEHAAMLEGRALIAIGRERQRSQSQFTSGEYRYCVTAVTLFRKPIEEALSEWLDSRFGGMSVRDVDGEIECGEGGDVYFRGEVNYDLPDMKEVVTLYVGEGVYKPLVDLGLDAPIVCDGSGKLSRGVPGHSIFDLIREWFNNRYGYDFDKIEYM